MFQGEGLTSTSAPKLHWKLSVHKVVDPSGAKVWRADEPVAACTSISLMITQMQSCRTLDDVSPLLTDSKVNGINSSFVATATGRFTPNCRG
eukprot:m.1362940 g.1362940  ORF g.1362940 m.1362940 type:complete len:92 (-) comp24944_c0_seq26:3070-3345(-)